MKVKTLKTKPKYFEMQLKGIKDFEVRKNDRDFQVGDSEYCKDGYVVLGTRKRLDLDANLLR